MNAIGRRLNNVLKSSNQEHKARRQYEEKRRVAEGHLHTFMTTDSKILLELTRKFAEQTNTTIENTSNEEIQKWVTSSFPGIQNPELLGAAMRKCHSMLEVERIFNPGLQTWPDDIDRVQSMEQTQADLRERRDDGFCDDDYVQPDIADIAEPNDTADTGNQTATDTTDTADNNKRKATDIAEPNDTAEPNDDNTVDTNPKKQRRVDRKGIVIEWMEGKGDEENMTKIFQATPLKGCELGACMFRFRRTPCTRKLHKDWLDSTIFEQATSKQTDALKKYVDIV